MAKLEVRSKTVGNYSNNVYVLVDPETSEALLVDTPFEPDEILKLLDDVNLKYIVFTHTDGDHVGAFAEVTSAVDAPILVHEKDVAGLPASPDRLIDEGDELTLGSSTIRVVHTPGHTPGSICLIADGILISGDTLFPGGPGNTKRDGGDFPAIVSGIRDKLFVLPDDTVVYPGHGDTTTIGAEKPHLQEWVDRGW